MFLRHLSLVNYKNFDSKTLEFDPVINCLVGDNGVGKTNVLDAIYHLCFGKSYFNPVSTQNIMHGADFLWSRVNLRSSTERKKYFAPLKKEPKK